MIIEEKLLPLVLLSLLKEKDDYSYNLFVEIQDHWNDFFLTSCGMVYCSLYHLEREKWISSYMSGNVKYYHLEQQGDEILKHEIDRLYHALMKLH